VFRGKSRPLILSHAASAPAGWARPPSKLAHITAFVRDCNARYNGRAIENPSAILCMNSATKTLNPRAGLAWFVAYVMKPYICQVGGRPKIKWVIITFTSGNLCKAIAIEV
jgi:hypothetical protein